MQNSTYDKLKIVAWIAAPLITFIGAVCVIWGVPHSEQITATLAALDTLIGSLLTISNINYNKGAEGEINNEEGAVELEGNYDNDH